MAAKQHQQEDDFLYSDDLDVILSLLEEDEEFQDTVERVAENVSLILKENSQNFVK